MLVPNQTFLIKTGGKTINHYRSLGYNVKPNQEFEVPLEHLMTTSHQKIALTCDGCGKEFHREYITYIEIKETGSPDYCRKCTTNNKVKKTVQERYGVDNVFQSEVFKEKQKNTLLERYGVVNSSQIEDVKIKRKQTFLEHYGVDNPNKCEDIRKKVINTCLEKYGVESALQVKEFREKGKITSKEKYGCEYYTQTDEYKERLRNTSLEKYGTDFPSQSEYIKSKIRNTCIEKYNTPYYSSTDECKEKVKKSWSNKTKEEIDEFVTKRKETTFNKYGVESANLLPSTQEKRRQTCLERYGYDHPQKVPEIRQRSIQTLLSNGNVPTSSQQLEVYNMIESIFTNNKAILNYVCDRSIFDIALFIDENKIDIEYDGWYWHQDTQKDRNRDEHFKLSGWKILRIKSANKIPTKDQLIEAINRLIKNGYSYTEIVLDDWINSDKYRKEENVS